MSEFEDKIHCARLSKDNKFWVIIDGKLMTGVIEKNMKLEELELPVDVNFITKIESNLYNIAIYTDDAIYTSSTSWNKFDLQDVDKLVHYTSTAIMYIKRNLFVTQDYKSNQCTRTIENLQNIFWLGGMYYFFNGEEILGYSSAAIPFYHINEYIVANISDKTAILHPNGEVTVIPSNQVEEIVADNLIIFVNGELYQSGRNNINIAGDIPIDGVYIKPVNTKSARRVV
jgi:hypothetical protein